MTVKIYTIQDIGPDKWDAFVRSHPDGSLYHLSAWHRTIEESYGYQTLYYVVTNGNGDIRAAVPAVNLKNLLLGRRTVSYPFSDYCDPLVASRDEFPGILESISASRGDAEFRTRNFTGPVEGLRADSSFSNYSIALDDGPGVLYSRLHKSCVQRRIKKSEREGVEIREGHSIQDLRVFHKLNLETRRRQGMPSQPYRFFRNLLRNFEDSGELKMLFAEYRGRTVGSLLLIGYRTASGNSGGLDTLYYKYGASVSKYFHLGFNPALFWKAITLAGEQGYSRLDLGRASDIDEKSLGEFKLHLGAEKSSLHYYSTSKAYAAAGKSPAVLLAGKCIKASPPWLSGLTGRMFYKYLG